MKNFQILIPCYNDWPSVLKLLDRLDEEIKQLGENFSVLIVNDGSNENLGKKEFKFKNIESIEVINMKTNQGHTRSNATGIKFLSKKNNFDYLIVMDGDGEDRPEEIKLFVEKVKKVNNTSVVAKRIKRSEGLIFTILYNFHKLITFIFTGHNMNFGHFTCLSKNDVNLISTKESLWLNFSGTVKKFVKHLEYIPCIRGKRYVQPSKMSFINLIIHSLSILAVFKYQVLFRSIFFLLILNLFSPSIITYIFQLLLIIFNILVFLISKRENSEEFRNCEKKIGSTESLYNSRL
ncbi:MAG: glycosyl transferase [Pelagibacterales bacterium MED-G40]|nr:MAG: glycosyl transferase [Pelagibacterales bacterium MED-G40]|tara:strand:- start:4144 stop:5019 length:876 start_codon:yes stop_codon:yes gene_type:complete